MALIDWNDSLKLEIESIDEQHKVLVVLINELHEAMIARQGKESLGKILKSLSDYTVYHFGTEENLFQKYEYPDYLNHKSEHDDLTKQVLELKSKFDSGENVITIVVMNFLKDWLQNHILSTDKKYSPFLKSKSVN